jgi:hypothetical protein
MTRARRRWTRNEPSLLAHEHAAASALASESVMRIDHLIFAVPELEDGVGEIEARFGVRAEGGGQHMGQGTHNKLLALGPTTYLEIIAPDPAQPEPPRPRPYGVDGVVGSGLAGWAVACDDIDLAVGRARSAGFDPGDVIEGHRRTADGTTLTWRLTSNARTAGVIPFLISWGDTPHPAASAPPGLRLESLYIEHPDPESIARALRILGTTVPVIRADRAALVAHIIGPTHGGKLR